jgi:hypothetical protein
MYDLINILCLSSSVSPPKNKMLLGRYLVVDTAEEEAVEAHCGEQRGELARVPERVDLPAHTRPPARTERAVQESVAHHHHQN